MNAEGVSLFQSLWERCDIDHYCDMCTAGDTGSAFTHTVHLDMAMSHCHMSAIKPHALAATAFLAAGKTPIRVKLVGLRGG
jgi:hypothetical protein